MTCEAYRALLERGFDGETTPEEARLMEEHEAECPDCAALRRALEQAQADMIAALDDVPPMPAGVHEGWMRAVLEDKRRQDRRAAAIRRSRLIRWGGMAAAVLFVLGGSYLTWDRMDDATIRRRAAGTVQWTALPEARDTVTSDGAADPEEIQAAPSHDASSEPAVLAAGQADGAASANGGDAWLHTAAKTEEAAEAAPEEAMWADEASVWIDGETAAEAVWDAEEAAEEPMWAAEGYLWASEEAAPEPMWEEEEAAWEEAAEYELAGAYEADTEEPAGSAPEHGPADAMTDVQITAGAANEAPAAPLPTSMPTPPPEEKRGDAKSARSKTDEETADGGTEGESSTAGPSQDLPGPGPDEAVNAADPAAPEEENAALTEQDTTPEDAAQDRSFGAYVRQVGRFLLACLPWIGGAAAAAAVAALLLRRRHRGGD